MNDRTRIYLDHAATSWPKSQSVLHAMLDFAKNCGVAAGRGGYRSAVDAERIVTGVRKEIAKLIEASQSDTISFHANGTAALNAAIHGVVRDGDHVVASAAEHNSVLRPLDNLSREGRIQLTVVPVGTDGCVNSDAFLRAIQTNTRLAVLTHASNVTGAIQPVAEVGKALRDRQTLLLCDAAQSFGAIPVSVQDFHVDLLAAPGHKSSGGPLGTAFLYVAPELHDEFQPWMMGGTGSQSESLEMPNSMPAKLEAGNLNVPALAGWSKALFELGDMQERMHQHRRVAEILLSGLKAIPNLKCYSSEGPLPIVSVNCDGLAPTDFAAILDSEFGIEARAGLHCAALIHDCIGTGNEGTLRLSASASTSEKDIHYAVEAVAQIVGEMTDS